MKRTDEYASLREWREARGLSQRDAAKILGISQSCYVKTELRRTAPRRELARRLWAKTNVAPESLMGLR